MCGIVGYISKYNISDYAWVEAGISAMKHRGPDGKGLWVSSDSKVVFGHNRLSIIELSSLGSQPMNRLDLGISITFNGEIYNYRELRDELVSGGNYFISNSDTEVLLVAYKCWGMDFLQKIHGMFAFALYDSNNKKVIIARDRVGEKPLFYYFRNNELCFASELKALLARPGVERKVNLRALQYYLAIGYVPRSLCLLDGINKLPAAHVIEYCIETGSMKVNRYWDIPQPDPISDSKQLYDELESLLLASVKRQMVADVPVGVLLSGGVDSSLITAMAAETVQQVNTFTVRFPGNKELDESAHARLIAKHFSTSHHELDATDSLDTGLLTKLAEQFDEPVNDSSMLPTYLVCKMIKEHCTVALGGDGGDELFGGYGKYNDLIRYAGQFQHIPFAFRKSVTDMANSILPIGFRGRNRLQYFGCDYHYHKILLYTHFDINAQKKLLGGVFDRGFEINSNYGFEYKNHQDIVGYATELDFNYYLAEDILTKVDRTSMLNSLEVRAPFLDISLIEFAFGKVPSVLKANGRDKKIILKKLCANKLPKDFDLQRKQGFSIPLSDMLKGSEWLSFFKAVLYNNESGIFSERYIDELFSGLHKGRLNSERLFGLVLFELWRSKYQVSF